MFETTNQIIIPMNTILVGGANPSEKYLSVGIVIPNIWKNKKCSKPPTSIVISIINPATEIRHLNAILGAPSCRFKFQDLL